MGGSSTIVLVRHGESALNAHYASKEQTTYDFRIDCALTDTGVSQAKQTAQFLESYYTDLNETPTVWVSPMLRAQQTMDAFAQLIDCEVKVNIGLQEYTKPGRCPEHPEHQLVTDESIEAFVDRVVEWVDEHFVRNSPPKHLLIFGHSMFFSILLSYIGTQCQHKLAGNNIAFELPNCCISVIQRHRPRHFGLLHVGSIQHLTTPTGHHTSLFETKRELKNKIND